MQLLLLYAGEEDFEYIDDEKFTVDRSQVHKYFGNMKKQQISMLFLSNTHSFAR